MKMDRSRGAAVDGHMSEAGGYPSRRLLADMYEKMVRIREFELAVKRTFNEHPGAMRGHTHLSDGIEATVVGALSVLGDGDLVMSSYRCHGYPIALGTPTNEVMAELYGRETGICKGRGGSMHLADPSRGFLGAAGIVGQEIPQATGAALAAQIAGDDRVVLCFFGDGASKQGAFHESLNIASLWKLPIAFVLINNGFQAYTRTEREDANAAAGEPLATKAKAYSMPGVTIDGSDVIEVRRALGEAVGRARQGLGPTLIESKVYRFSAHGNAIVTPPVPTQFPEHEAIAVYNAHDEYEAALEKDPVATFRALLLDWGTVTAEGADATDSAIRAEIQEAVRYALDSPWPDTAGALDFVYA